MININYLEEKVEISFSLNLTKIVFAVFLEVVDKKEAEMIQNVARSTITYHIEVVIVAPCLDYIFSAFTLFISTIAIISAFALKIKACLKPILVRWYGS